MIIYTSYYDNLRNLDIGVVPISIAKIIPDWYHGLEYRELVPNYVFDYKKEVLDFLDADKVVSDLKELSNGNSVALICHEVNHKCCHRYLVADWLTQNGYNTVEIF